VRARRSRERARVAARSDRSVPLRRRSGRKCHVSRRIPHRSQPPLRRSPCRCQAIASALVEVNSRAMRSRGKRRGRPAVRIAATASANPGPGSKSPRCLMAAPVADAVGRPRRGSRDARPADRARQPRALEPPRRAFGSTRGRGPTASRTEKWSRPTALTRPLRDGVEHILEGRPARAGRLPRRPPGTYPVSVNADARYGQLAVDVLDDRRAQPDVEGDRARRSAAIGASTSDDASPVGARRFRTLRQARPRPARRATYPPSSGSASSSISARARRPRGREPLSSRHRDGDGRAQILRLFGASWPSITGWAYSPRAASKYPTTAR